MKSFKTIADTLRQHYKPKRAVILQHFHFHKRDQAVGESVTAFDEAIRKLATHCKFGDNLEEALRDRFVCGLRHETIQCRLLSEVDLSYTKAMEIALAMEAADRDTKLSSLQTNLPRNCNALHGGLHHNKPATAVIVLGMVPVSASLRRLNTMLMANEVTLHQRVAHRER